MSVKQWLDDFGDNVVRGLKTAGMVAGEFITRLAEDYERTQNSPAPCYACKREFIRKTMKRIYDIPEYSGRWWLLFCDDCRLRLQNAYMYRGKLISENRRVLAQVYRAWDKQLPGTLTIDEWEATLNFYQWRCAYCGGPYEAIEHYIPIDEGGGTTADNCVPACKKCNSAKGARHPNTIGPSSRDPASIKRVGDYLLTKPTSLLPPQFGNDSPTKN